MKSVHTLLRRTFRPWWMRTWHVVSSSSLEQRGPTVSCVCWVECCQQVKGDVSLIYRLLNVPGIFEAKITQDYLPTCKEFSSYCYPLNRCALNCLNDQLSANVILSILGLLICVWEAQSSLPLRSNVCRRLLQSLLYKALMSL